MSLRGGDFRCEIDPELFEQLKQMAAHENKHIHVLGGDLLEKAIAGEFHARMNSPIAGPHATCT